MRKPTKENPNPYLGKHISPTTEEKIYKLLMWLVLTKKMGVAKKNAEDVMEWSPATVRDAGNYDPITIEEVSDFYKQQKEAFDHFENQRKAFSEQIAEIEEELGL